MDLDSLDANESRKRLADARDSLHHAATFRAALRHLSRRQREVAGLLALGVPAADLPRVMRLSRRTVREHLRRLRCKLRRM
ncbi:MAG: LuxR C-terminal-related transcriptional regulator [Planctomycetota bacterium]